MKKLIILIGLSAILLTAVMVVAKICGHIPIPHDHGNEIRNCYGYAQAIAFGKEPGDSECDPNTTFATKIYTDYFPFKNKPDLSGIYPGCIVVFGENRVHPNGHAAYVTDVPNPLEDIGDIKVDHIPWQGAAPQTGVELRDVIEIQGDPAGYHTGGVQPNTALLTFRNSFGDGWLRTGKDKMGEWLLSRHNTTKEYIIGSQLDIMAIDNQEHPTGYKQRYRHWEKDGEYKGNQNPRTIDIDGNATWEAVFRKEFNITFRNEFEGASGYPGVIKVNGSTKNSPHVEKVLEYNSVTGQAVWQVYNGIEYTFSQWSDGYQSSSRTFVPNDHGIYTAEYTGKPRPMTYYNLHTNNTPGENVTLYWNEHPNENVLKYKIWRKVKDSITGETEGPTLLVTLNRGTTSWTDNEYMITEGYVEDLLWYDVRARWYIDENTYVDADPDYISVFGEGPLFKNVNSDQESKQDGFSHPTYEIVAYPNPFNPATTLMYQLKEPSHVTLRICDILGREIITLVEKDQPAGYYSVQWSGKDAVRNGVSSGLYFYQFWVISENGKEIYRKTGKLLFVK